VRESKHAVDLGQTVPARAGDPTADTYHFLCKPKLLSSPQQNYLSLLLQFELDPMSSLFRIGQVLKGRASQYTITKEIQDTVWFAK
jgi:hypothetical protein